MLPTKVLWRGFCPVQLSNDTTDAINEWENEQVLILVRSVTQLEHRIRAPRTCETGRGLKRISFLVSQPILKFIFGIVFLYISLEYWPFCKSLVQ